MRRAGHSSLFIALFFYAGNAWSGAWLQPEGKGMAIGQATYFASEAYFDRSSNKTVQPRYQKYEFQPYIEYGLSPSITVGGSAYLQQAYQSGTSNIGLADPELFLRTPLWKDDKNILSLQPLIKFPSRFSKDQSPRGGSASTDAEISLLYGRNIHLFGAQDYADARIGYRHRGNGLHDQWRADIVLGLALAEKWQITPAIRAVKATAIPAATTFSEDGAQDYDLIKFELGTHYSIAPKRTVSLTAFDHADGRQTGDGAGVTLGFRQDF